MYGSLFVLCLLSNVLIDRRNLEFGFRRFQWSNMQCFLYKIYQYNNCSTDIIWLFALSTTICEFFLIFKCWILFFEIEIFYSSRKLFFQFIGVSKKPESCCCSCLTIMMCHCLSYGQIGAYTEENPILEAWEAFLTQTSH